MKMIDDPRFRLPAKSYRAGESFGRGKLDAGRHQAIEDAGRVAEKLASKAGGGDQKSLSADRQQAIADTGRVAEKLAANLGVADRQHLEDQERQAEGQVAGGYAKHGSASAPTGAQADTGRVAEKLAEKAGVGRRTVERAIKVREEGIPEVNEAVANGEVTLNMAEKIVRLSPAAQKRVIDAPAAQRRRPADSAEVARRLQRRLSAYALVQAEVCRDIERMGELADAMTAGFHLTNQERRELAEIRVRLFDARQVLETEG